VTRLDGRPATSTVQRTPIRSRSRLVEQSAQSSVLLVTVRLLVRKEVRVTDYGRELRFGVSLPPRAAVALRFT
jgi:hypothetical protein